MGKGKIISTNRESKLLRRCSLGMGLALTQGGTEGFKVGKSARGLLILVFMVVMGLALPVSRDPSAVSKVKSLEKYWAETGIKASDLEDLIQDYSCNSSLRYFLACVNATSAVLARNDETLIREGQTLMASPAPGHRELAERQMLEPWRKLYLSAPETVKKLSFLKLIQAHFAAIKIDQEAAVAAGLNGFLSVFKDPHTYIMPLDYFYQVVSKAAPKTKSVGFVISRTANNYFIRKIYQNSPAEEAGLKKGDFLIAINGKNVSELTYIKVNELIRAESTSVQLKILRGRQVLDIVVARKEVELSSVTSEVLNRGKLVGLLSINKFSKDSCAMTEKAIKSLMASQVEGMILDLRDNSGGQIDEAACIAGLFLGSKKKIFQLQFFDTSREREEVYSQKSLLYGGALAILVNRGSASASELLAGSLRDYGRALLVGETTFGKGTFQEGEVWNLNSKIGLFASKGFYILPSGFSPQMYGLSPDIEVHFAKDIQPREADQYIYSLYPPSGPHLVMKQVAKKPACQPISTLGSDDNQLLKAEQALFCTQALAGVTFDNDESF